MASLRHVDRKNLLKALNECEELGEPSFLQKHGYRPSKKFRIHHNGKSYPSKAIVGVAADLAPRQFSGGRARLEKLLSRFGFRLGPLVLIAVSRSLVESAKHAHPQNLLNSQHSVETFYFASGSNRAPQIKGFAAVGQALGVSVPNLTPDAEDVLHALAGTSLPVFVDSGAFSEVSFTKDGPKVVRPIDEEQWQNIMNLYSRLSMSLGPQLFAVAPDMVGHQDETLSRIDRWRNEIRSLINCRSNVIVVAQKGAALQHQFDATVEEILQTSQYIKGLPCKKAATTTNEVALFAEKRRPDRIHLLGIGLRNKRALEVANAVASASPNTQLSMDSCLLTESTGHSNGRASHPSERPGGPRIFTAARRLAKKLKSAGEFLKEHVEEIAIRLAWGPSPIHSDAAPSPQLEIWSAA